jgi:hypothetical protein
MKLKVVRKKGACIDKSAPIHIRHMVKMVFVVGIYRARQNYLSPKVMFFAARTSGDYENLATSSTIQILTG